jgi:hypothetical protein
MKNIGGVKRCQNQLKKEILRLNKVDAGSICTLIETQWNDIHSGCDSMK